MGMSIKKSDIKWVNTDIVPRRNFSENVLIKWELFELDKEIDLEYKVLKFRKDKNEEYYQLVVSLPFSFESGWIQSEPEDWTKYAIDRLKSKLEGKYKQLQKRDKEYRKLLYKFKDVTKIKDNDEAVRIFKKYYHTPLEKSLNNIKVGEIFNEMLKTEIDNLEIKEDLKLSKEKFVKMHLNATCEYCGITMKQINFLSGKDQLQTKRQRGYSIEIDQKDPYGFYTDDNCVASCYWCNNAKTDEFSIEEFKEIAESIKNVWNKRLEPYNTRVKFPPENSSIWNKEKNTNE